MNIVLDAGAMIAFLRGEPGKEVVRDHLSDAGNACHAHALNLCEVHYDFIRLAGDRAAKAALRDLRRVGVRPARSLSAGFWMRVGYLKGTIRKVSIADCFAITLAEELDATILTSDHHEFDPLAERGVCRVTFIR
jgi:predicted nucleic acid-binding protein